jgi:hypothetical protein
MPLTELLASGHDIQVGPNQSQLAELDLSSYRAIRLSVGNWGGSSAPVTLSLSHVDQPNTDNANAISELDSFTVAPSELVSKLYEVPGEVVIFLASPLQPPVGGISVDFTIYGRTD